MLTLTNLTHEPIPQYNTALIRRWLRDNYQRHLADDTGEIDAGALADALAWDKALNKTTALDYAREFKLEMDGVK